MENVSTTQPISEPVPEISTSTPQAAPSSSLPLKKIGMAFVAILVTAAIAIGGFLFMRSRASQNPAVANRPITLTYWGMMEDTPALQSAIKQFETDHPGVDIQYSVQSPKDYSERLIAACGRNQCPDIFRFHSTWASQYVQRGLLATLPTSVMSSTEFESSFYPVIASDLRTPNGYVGIPVMFDGLGLYINKRILQASGKSVPTTWDELRTLAMQLTVRGADGSIDRSGVAMGTSTNVDHFSDILSVLIYQNGGDPLKPEAFGSATQNSTGPSSAPASLVGDALTFYSQFTRNDKVWNETMPNSTYAFAIERTAMILAPAYRAAEIKKINPNFEFSVHPIPQLPGKPVTYANYWVEGVSQSSKEQEMAWRFLKYLSSREILEKLHTTNAGALQKEISPRPDMAATVASDPYAGAIVNQAQNARSSYMSSRTFDKGINDKLISLYSEIITKMASGTRYDESAIRFSSQVNELVSSYGITKLPAQGAR